MSQIGDKLAMVFFPWLVYSTTESAFSTGVMLALYALPYVLFGMFAGVVIDRFNKRAVLITADLVRAAFVLSVPFVAEQWLEGVYLLSFLTSSVTVFFDPCKLAILPDLVSQRQLLRANSFLATGETVTDALGFALAGFVAFYVSAKSAFAADAGTFLASAATLMFLKYSVQREKSARFSRRGVAQEAREGLVFLLQHRGLAANTGLVMAAALGVGASYPLTFLLAMDVIGNGSRSMGLRAFGLMESSLALGYLCGALIMAALGERVRKGIAMTAGIGTMGAGFAMIGASHTLYVALAPFFIVGLANAAALIAIDTYCQEVVPERLRGRVWGVRFTLTQGIYALSVMAGGALAVSIGVPTLFLACGSVVAVAGIAGIFIRSIRRA